MLRRLFRLQEPRSAREAWDNLIRAGWWEFGLIVVVAIAGIAAKTAFPSDLPVILGVLIVILFVPPALAALAVLGELGAVVRLRARERTTRPPTGNPLIDHDVLVGVIFSLVLVVGVTAYVILHQR